MSRRRIDKNRDAVPSRCLFITCDVCAGQRYNSETLEVRFKDKTIYDVLKMTVEEATDFFKAHFKIHQKLAS